MMRRLAIAVAALLIAGFGALCNAQEKPAAAPAPAPAPQPPPRLKDLPPAEGVLPLSAPLVDRSHVEQAYRLAEDWVHGGRVEMAGVKPIPASGVVAVRVTLRWLGKSMGSGQAESSRFDPEHVVDLSRLTGQATALALIETKRQLEDRQRKTVVPSPPAPRTEPAPEGAPAPRSEAPSDASAEPPTPVPPATPPTPTTVQPATDTKPAAELEPLPAALDMARVGPLLQIDVQVAHNLEAVHVPPGVDELAVFDRFAPGYHGLRLTRAGADAAARDAKKVGDAAAADQANVAWLWPASAIAANVRQHSQIVQLLADLGLRSDQVKLIGRDKGPVLQRFEVIHMVRPTRDLPRTVLVRGNVILPPAPLGGHDVEFTAHRVAKHLIRCFREDGSMAGTYQPTSDQFNPPSADTHDVALSVYTLTRYADAFSDKDRDGNAALIFDARQTARRGVRYVTSQLHGPAARPDAASAALLILTITESASLVDYKPERDLLVNSLLGRQREDGPFLGAAAANAPMLNARTQAMILAALSSVFEQTREARVGRAVDRCSTWLWAKMDATTLLDTLPWLPIAELRMNRVAPPLVGDAEANKQWKAKLTAIRDLIIAMRGRQVRIPPRQGPADVIGGYDLTPRSADTPPRPDWRTSESLTLLALSLREPALMDKSERVPLLLESGLAVRFLAQLTFDESACFYVRNLADALGGVRENLWENDLRVETSAMTLLAIAELQTTLQGMK